MSIPDVSKGYERQWIKCKTCGLVAYYDFVPFSLSSPIMTLPCHHGVGDFNGSVDRIGADEAEIEIGIFKRTGLWLKEEGR